MAVLIVSLAAAPTPSFAQSAEPVMVIDLRPGDDATRKPSREHMLAEFAGIEGVQLLTDNALVDALNAANAPAVDAAARKKAAELMSMLLVMRSRDDCSGRGTTARRASALLAGLKGAGRQVDAELLLAYSYMLVCADRAGAASEAKAAVRLLRRLGQATAPAGVLARVWQRYATPSGAIATVRTRIISRPEGAAIFVDHRPESVGIAPVEIDLFEGPHIIGATTAHGVDGTWIDVAPDVGSEATPAADSPVSVAVEIAEPAAPWSTIRTTVAEFRRGAKPANAIALAKLMRETGARFAIVLSHSASPEGIDIADIADIADKNPSLASDDRAEVWVLAAEASAARRLRAESMSAVLPLADAIVQESRRLDGRLPENDVQILPPEAKKKEKAPQKWWVYASVIGAVAVGATVLSISSSADDRQRVRLHWP